jgi:hypothetical protein
VLVRDAGLDAHGSAVTVATDAGVDEDGDAGIRRAMSLCSCGATGERAFQVQRIITVFFAR